MNFGDARSFPRAGGALGVGATASMGFGAARSCPTTAGDTPGIGGITSAVVGVPCCSLPRGGDGALCIGGTASATLGDARSLPRARACALGIGGATSAAFGSVRSDPRDLDGTLGVGGIAFAVCGVPRTLPRAGSALIMGGTASADFGDTRSLRNSPAGTLGIGGAASPLDAASSGFRSGCRGSDLRVSGLFPLLSRAEGGATPSSRSSMMSLFPTALRLTTSLFPADARSRV